MWENIKGVFSKVKDFFSGVFEEAWKAIKGVFDDLVDFFDDIWETIKDTFTKLGTSIANAISDSVKAGINGIISLIENTINGAIRIINGAIKLINKIPMVDVGYVSELSLPRLAKGGIVDDPTIAEIGENGREAIIPLENNKGWIRELAAELKNTMITPITEFTREATNTTLSYNQYNEIVRAFKDALSQMKVELDDDEMGAFVEKTVANAIYT